MVMRSSISSLATGRDLQRFFKRSFPSLPEQASPTSPAHEARSVAPAPTDRPAAN